MHRIEKVMTKRATTFKVAVAVVALLLVLWATGSTIGSIWMIPVIVFVLWIAIQLALRFNHRHSGASHVTD
jgi:O-antigen ligase